MARVPSDVVKCLFHFLGPEKFDADIPKIHQVFFEILNQPSTIPSIKEDIIFEDSKPYQYSETITFALDRLQKSNLLHCNNPRLDQFEISEKLSELRSIEKLFDESEIDIIKRGAEQFKRAFNLS